MFAGNTADKDSVAGILARLKERFAVEQCVFVGDRGMVTEKNMALMAQAGYPYIVGYHKRGRLVSDQLPEQLSDVEGYSKLKENLFYLEVFGDTLDDETGAGAVRPLPRPGQKLHDAAFRERALEEAKTGLAALVRRLGETRRGPNPTSKSAMIQVAELLTKKGVQAFFNVEYDNGTPAHERVPEAIAKDAMRDGKFLLRTSTDRLRNSG